MRSRLKIFINIREDIDTLNSLKSDDREAYDSLAAIIHKTKTQKVFIYTKTASEKEQNASMMLAPSSTTSFQEYSSRAKYHFQEAM
eukprot:3103727-Amphidinium_carterae.1